MRVKQSKILEVSNLTFRYDKFSAFKLSVDKFYLKVGEKVLIRGSSGSGKSTFMNCISGISRPSRGSIQILGCQLANLSRYQLDRFRGNHIGIIFQTFNLIPFLSVFDNIRLGVLFSFKKRERLEDDLRGEIRRLCESMNLDYDDLQNATISELSIGQQQRVAAVRSLLGKPELIIADEPTSALDNQTRDLFMETFFESVDFSTQSVLFVSHDIALESAFDRVVDLPSN